MTVAHGLGRTAHFDFYSSAKAFSRQDRHLNHLAWASRHNPQAWDVYGWEDRAGRYEIRTAWLILAC